MTDWSQSFDAYARRARLFPALLTILPVVVLALASIPSLTSAGVGATLTTVALSFGVIYLLADVARARGGRIEKRLLDEWGGWPTTIMLRHSSSDLPAGTKARYRTALASNVPNCAFPTADEEAIQPEVADDQYASAVHWLKEQCRGPDYGLVLKENANYGFRRNLLGLRPIGATLSFIVLGVSMVFVLLRAAGGSFRPLPARFDFSLVPLPIWACLGVAVLALLGWFGLVGRAYVREGADAYARSLLACCDRLQ